MNQVADNKVVPKTVVTDGGIFVAPFQVREFADPDLIPIGEMILNGQRLGFDEGMKLWHSRDIFALSAMADYLRRRRHGNVAYYNVNRHLNYTNICALSCKFCEFHRKRGEAGAYEYSLEDIFRIAAQADTAGATEIHIVGGLHPWLPWDWYLEMMRGLRQRHPRLHVKAFTAIEINHFAKIARLSVRDVLVALKEAGLGSMPGGGAEVFDDRVHDEAFKGKLDARGWLEIHRTAHQLGIRTNATLLYGHIESRAERIKHLLALRELQDEAENGGGFQTIIPLSFIPDGSELGHLPGPTGLEDLKMLAIARIMLDNFAHVKAFWIMQSMKLSQVSLNWGVDDLDGTVVWYDITKREGGEGEGKKTHQEMTLPELLRLIIEAGFEPVERDTLYRRVVRDEKGWRSEGEGEVKRSKVKS